MGPERLGRERTVESIAAVTAPGRSPWADAVLVRYPPHSVGLGPGAAVSLPGAPAGGHDELGFPAVDSAGRFIGAGWRNRPALPVLGLCQREGHPAWTGLQHRLPCAGRIQLVERGVDPAAGKHPPPMVPATAAAIPGLPLPAVDSCRPPAGQRKLFSRARPPPERTQPHSLAGAPGSGGGCAPVV